MHAVFQTTRRSEQPRCGALRTHGCPVCWGVQVGQSPGVDARSYATSKMPGSASNTCSLHFAGVDLDDDLQPHNLEQLRRSIAMLRPGQKTNLDRDRAIRILEELQRLQRSDRRYHETVDQLRAILDRLEGA
jgi:hypothetical protein